ncbi:hypothetical protein [Nonomuraea angiospora]
MAAERLKETQRLENERELAGLRARNDAWQFDTEVAERLRRTQRRHDDSRAVAELETQTTLHALRMERERHTEESETGRLRIEREQQLKSLELAGELELARSRALADHERALLDVERLRMRADIDNQQSPASLQAKLIGLLPEIMAKLPQPEELRMVSINGSDRTTVSGLLAELAAMVGVLRSAIDRDTPGS